VRGATSTLPEPELRTIEIGSDIVRALVEESRIPDEDERQGHSSERESLQSAMADTERKAARLLDGYLEGLIEPKAYRKKAEDLETEANRFRTTLGIQL